MAAHCSFANGQCEHGDKPDECRKKSTVFCHNLRDKNESDKKEKEHGDMG